LIIIFINQVLLNYRKILYKKSKHYFIFKILIKIIILVILNNFLKSLDLYINFLTLTLLLSFFLFLIPLFQVWLFPKIIFKYLRFYILFNSPFSSIKINPSLFDLIINLYLKIFYYKVTYILFILLILGSIFINSK